MTVPLRGGAGLLLCTTLTFLLAACGGGFGGSGSPDTPDRTIHSYVALGDGFTAAPYTGDTEHDDGCLRSAVNYPALVAEELGVIKVHDVSCTGATTKALTTKVRPARGNRSVPAQLDAVDKDTDLVSIGIGIEDHDLLAHMFEVCLARPCRAGSITAQAINVCGGLGNF